MIVCNAPPSGPAARIGPRGSIPSICRQLQLNHDGRRSHVHFRAMPVVAMAADALRPPLKWAGGKRWQLPHLQSLWAPHAHRPGRAILRGPCRRAGVAARARATQRRQSAPGRRALSVAGLLGDDTRRASPYQLQRQSNAGSRDSGHAESLNRAGRAGGAGRAGRAGGAVGRFNSNLKLN
jgi:hypothetical protein